jgi:hypothetical protein
MQRIDRGVPKPRFNPTLDIPETEIAEAFRGIAYHLCRPVNAPRPAPQDFRDWGAFYESQ